MVKDPGMSNCEAAVVTPDLMGQAKEPVSLEPV